MNSILFLALLAGLALPPRLAGAEELGGVVSVVDGDTVEIHGTRIRLHGIGAPKSGQQCLDAMDQPWRCGQKAALALADRIGRAPATCRGSEADIYRRLIAVCFQGGEDLNGWMSSRASGTARLSAPTRSAGKRFRHLARSATGSTFALGGLQNAVMHADRARLPLDPVAQ